MKIIKENQINEIVTRLKNLEIGILPTDTIYGLVGLARSEEVKRRIYAIKERSFAKQLVLQVGIHYDLKKIVAEINEPAKKLMKAFFPGALTLIFKASAEFIEQYDWEIDTVAIRIPRHELFLEVLNTLNEPLFVTSVNKSGELANNDLSFVKDKVDFFVDDGKIYDVIPSTIVDVSNSEITILREGVITKSQIMDVL